MISSLVVLANLVAQGQVATPSASTIQNQTSPKPFDLACTLSETLASRKNKETPFVVMGETQQTIPLKISKQSIKVEHYVGNITIALVEGALEKRVMWTVTPEENFQSLSLSAVKPAFTVVCKNQPIAP